jgi:alkylated DNA nucleotide flippase Atl1
MRGIVGRVEKRFLKIRRGSDMVELDRDTPLVCLTGLGLDGDIHANRLSPRQILVTLQSELDELLIAPGALFENMVVSISDAQHFRPGTAIVTEGGVEIRLTMYCEPCKRILPVVTGLNAMINRRGILGSVVNGGEIQAGDAFSVIPGRYQPLPESPTQKFLDFVRSVPAGGVVRYLDVTIAIGVDASFVRAVPGYIKRNISEHLPVHRIVNGQGRLLDFLPGQAKKLAFEGVGIDGAGAVDLQNFLWRG